jgi:hypothetical protein
MPTLALTPLGTQPGLTHWVKAYKQFDHQHKPKTVYTLRNQHNSAEQMLVQLKRKWASDPSFKPSKLRLETTYYMHTDAALQEDSVHATLRSLTTVDSVQEMLNTTTARPDNEHVRVTIVPVEVETWLAHLEDAVLASRVTGQDNFAPSHEQLKKWAVTVSMLGLQSRELARLATAAARDPNTTPLAMSPSFIHDPRHPTSKWHLIMFAEVTETTRLGVTKYFCRDINLGLSARRIGGHLTQEGLFDKIFATYPTTWATKIALDQNKRCTCHGRRLVHANRKLCKFRN